MKSKMFRDADAAPLLEVVDVLAVDGVGDSEPSTVSAGRSGGATIAGFVGSDDGSISSVGASDVGALRFFSSTPTI